MKVWEMLELPLSCGAIYGIWDIECYFYLEIHYLRGDVINLRKGEGFCEDITQYCMTA